MGRITDIAVFILDSFLHIWPYLVLTIPLAVIVKLTNVSTIIKRTLSKNPLVSIFLATVFGAFSPLCSCGVIPVIASLLIGGVPLAPVMSFWIASPSMDPEIFLLSITALGWELSVWRLLATFIISLVSGYMTHIAVKSGFLGKELLKASNASPVNNLWKHIWEKYIKIRLTSLKADIIPRIKSVHFKSISAITAHPDIEISCCVNEEIDEKENLASCSTDENHCKHCSTQGADSESFIYKVLNESWKASALVVKFMTLAFFINALIAFYIPEHLITGLLGGDSPFAVLVSTFVGVPTYTSNITALPLIGGLLDLGMNPGAALAFLITGPTTTLPALMAVWGIVKRKVFLLYVSYSLFGAIIFGYLYTFLN
jgi:uncharacterized membrane protein YraQ (UPF0718 family)